jgi:hypothetical protein
MAESAPQIQYRQELVAEFEEGMSWLRRTTVTEAVIKGNQATFLVGGSGGATAVSRGINGLIAARADSLTQNTATLTEWHDLVRKTRFNIFQSQGDQRRLMQETTRKVLNRRIDQDIIDQLDTATTSLGAATSMSLNVVAQAVTTLGENEVDTSDEDAMWAVMTPAVRGYLMQIPEFASADFVDMKFLTGNAKRVLRWAGFNWIFHPNLSGTGTASESCYFFHRDAIGSAFDSGEGLDTAIGFNEEQDYSFARASSFTGAVILQQSGLVQFLHDASAI